MSRYESGSEQAAMSRQLEGALPPVQPRVSWLTAHGSRLTSHLRSPLYRNGYALIISALSTSGLGIVYWAVAARFYDARDVGLNSAAISGMLLFSGIAQLNLSGTLIRFLPTAGGAMARVVRRAYLASLAAGLILGLGLLLLRDFWSPIPELFNGNTAFLLWFIVAVLAWSVFALQDFVLTGLRQAKWVPIENIVFAVIKIGLLLAFASRLQQFGVFLSWTIPTLGAILAVNALIFARLIPRRVMETRDHVESILPRQLVNFVAANYLGFLFFLISGTLLPIMVKIEIGPQAAAYFFLAWIIAYAFQLISLNMTASLTVEGAIDQARLREYSYRVLMNIARLVVPLVLVCVVAAPYILDIFGPGYASNGANALRLLAVAAIPNIVVVVFVTIARVQRRNVAIALVQGVLCILSLALSAVFLHVYGIAGVGLAWVISQSAIAVALLVYRRSWFVARDATPTGRPGSQSTADVTNPNLEDT